MVHPVQPEGQVAHPYVRTEPSTELQLHDLRRRLADLDHDEHERLDWSGVDAPAPLVGFEPTSDAVALARAVAAEDGEPGVWVSDHEDAEQSFGDLVRAMTLSRSGSGYLTLEPHEGADVVRTVGVITATGHRHFPVGAGEPYLDVSLGARMVAVPLRAVVSYEPTRSRSGAGNKRHPHSVVPSGLAWSRRRRDRVYCGRSVNGSVNERQPSRCTSATHATVGTRSDAVRHMDWAGSPTF